jgi:putative ABC transport system substrate-binding protein
VEVILAPSSTETAAILEATKTVPVVFATHADPVGIGHVASLARPGGNATGLTMLLTEMVAKELEALKEALPNARRFGVLFTPTAPSHIPAVEAAERAGRRLQVELRMVPVRSEGDLHDEFAKMAQDGVDGLLVISSSFTFSRRALLADLAIKHRLPSVFGTKDNVFAGGLMSYAPDLRDLYRQAATYVDKILRGAKPADLPVEQASRYELVINLKTAKTLGIAIPPTLLARADEVIE